MDESLLVMAFDHRTSLVRGLFGGDEAAADARAPRVKELVLEGLLLAQAEHGAARHGRPGILVDAGYGGSLVARARAAGVRVAVAIEASGRREVGLEDGAGLRARLDALRPDYAKVLVRLNPTDPPDSRARQLDVLVGLSARLEALGQRLMFELLVPPTAEQEARFASDPARYDSELRPQLTVEAIALVQAAGIRSALYKLEGFEDAQAAAGVIAQVRAGDPEAGVLILGRGASTERVEHWLRVAAAQPGFDGFAIGRSIWWEPARDWLAGIATTSDAIARVAAAYARAARTWAQARQGAAAGPSRGQESARLRGSD